MNINCVVFVAVGYAVTENGNNNCLLKTSDNKASLVSCKNGYTQFSMEGDFSLLLYTYYMMIDLFNFW